MTVDLIRISAALAHAPDLVRVREVAAYYTNGKFDVVVFSHSTCVFPALKAAPDESAKERLSALRNLSIGFEVREMDDRNFVVKFNEQIFGIVLRDEYASLRDQIVQQTRVSTSAEKLKGLEQAPDDHVFIGLFARTRLLADIDDQTPIRMVSATVENR